MHSKINHQELLRDVEITERQLGEKHGCKIEIKIKIYPHELSEIISACNSIYRRFNPNGYLDIRVQTHQKDVVLFRRIACYMSREMGYTYYIIAGAFGIDHSTVIANEKVIKKLLKNKNEITLQYIELIEYTLLNIKNGSNI